jgi:hypothetical protein
VDEQQEYGELDEPPRHRALLVYLPEETLPPCSSEEMCDD